MLPAVDQIRARTAAGLPSSACDCHVHVVGPQDRFPMRAQRQYTPPPALTRDLRMFHAALGIGRCVLIQPSFYGTDNTCMLDAMAELGGAARGVAVVAPDIADDELRRLDTRGVRGVRINLQTAGIRNPAVALQELSALARRIRPFGWHIQIYAGLPLIVATAAVIADLSVPVVIDHFGGLAADQGVGQPGLSVVTDLVRNADVYVKLSAPYRISSAVGYSDVEPIARALIAAAPDRMLWGTDWPHTNRLPGLAATAVHPYRQVDDRSGLADFLTWCSDEGVRRMILTETPAKLYRF
ncbi:amidohydrolase family protein [Xanthobacteraceae bacterium Astr-EGSB]|uniref:amidohydrolase family protein n=1 Tax=Astrobacterium formosum TaxID=3069710 RepID=UPI0027B0692F|nr:amidohydrolase family protein [Xanthobacteraceae bacterium Astr-EGSB]